MLRVLVHTRTHSTHNILIHACSYVGRPFGASRGTFRETYGTCKLNLSLNLRTCCQHTTTTTPSTLTPDAYKVVMEEQGNITYMVCTLAAHNHPHVHSALSCDCLLSARSPTPVQAARAPQPPTPSLSCAQVFPWLEKLPLARNTRVRDAVAHMKQTLQQAVDDRRERWR
jgi:hypothetical protein